MASTIVRTPPSDPEIWATVRLFEIVFDVEDAPEITPPLPDVEVAILLSELSASSEMDLPDSFDILLNVALVCVLEDAVERLAPIAIIPPASPVALELLLSTVVALKFNAPVVLMMPPQARRPISADSLAQLAKIDTLSELELHGNYPEFSVDVAVAVASIRNLRTLTVVYAQVDSKALSVLTKLPDLRALTLSWNQSFTDADAAETASNRTK